MSNTNTQDQPMEEGKELPPQSMEGGPSGPPQRRGPTSRERAPMDWHYLIEVGAITHLPQHCTICNVYIQHTLTASMMREPSYKRSQVEHDRMIRRPEERAIGRADRIAEELETARQRIRELEAELERERLQSSTPSSSRAGPYTGRAQASGTRQRVDAN